MSGSNPIRNVKKNFISIEDTLNGVGTVLQNRNGSDAIVNKLDIPFGVTTELALQALDVSRYTRARLYITNTDYTDYIYDETALSGIAPNVGVGFWVSVLKLTQVSVPVSASEPGLLGQWAADANFFYIHDGTAWKRVGITTW